MKYSKGINYQLEANESIATLIYGYATSDIYYSIDPNGVLIVKKGYAWDGASGAIDTKTNIRASLLHDALCQMIGNDELPIQALSDANRLYRDICLADGMSKFRAWLEYKAIKFYFRNGVKPKGDRKVIST
jgi:hypothetical protein